MKTQILSLIVLIVVTLTSCQNFNGFDNNTVNSEDAVLKSAELASNDILIESISEELRYEAEFFAQSERILKQLARVKGNKKHIMDGHKGSPYVDGYTPEITIDTAETGYPVVITIDYGDSTILKNGRAISGIVTIEISAEKHTDGATRTITYTDCSIDSVTVNGVCTEVFNGDDENSRAITTSSDVTFVLADGTVIDRTGNHVRNWVGGLDTPLEHEDDIIETTGSTEASTSTGNVWVREIIIPLVKIGECHHHVSGVVELSQNGEVLATLDYGDGECDELAILTVNGEEIEIELGHRKPKPNVDHHKRNNKKRGERS